MTTCIALCRHSCGIKGRACVRICRSAAQPCGEKSTIHSTKCEDACLTYCEVQVASYSGLWRDHRRPGNSAHVVLPHGCRSSNQQPTPFKCSPSSPVSAAAIGCFFTSVVRGYVIPAPFLSVPESCRLGNVPIRHAVIVMLWHIVVVGQRHWLWGYILMVWECCNGLDEGVRL